MDGPARRVVRRAAAKSVRPAMNTVLAGGEVLQIEESPRAKRTTFSRKRLTVTLSSVLVVAIAFVGVKAVLASQKVVTKPSIGAPALKGEIDPTKLKGEGDGRINILLLGVGGEQHAGGKLTDTIMVASIDPVHKTVAMLSIPRDLYVKIPGYGYNKINAAGSFGGPELSKEVVGGILDLPIHYYLQADFNGFKQAVNAVGGVAITNKTNLYDPEYPCDNGRKYCKFNLPAGNHVLDGETALKYARCRHGVCGSDFGRAARQQELLLALREKTMAASTLSNPLKIAGLIDSVGDHVRTDLQLNESQKLAALMKDINVDTVTTKVLTDGQDGLLMSGARQFPGAGSTLIPRAGAFNYSEIQELTHSIFVDGYLKQEAATVEVQNGSGQPGLAERIAKQLKAYSYNVTGIGNAEITPTSHIIDYSNGKKPYTVQYLQRRFNATVTKAPSEAGATTSDIVIIIGSNYKPVTGTSSSSQQR